MRLFFCFVFLNKYYKGILLIKIERVILDKLYIGNLCQMKSICQCKELIQWSHVINDMVKISA